MTNDEVFAVVKAKTLEVIFDLDPSEVRPDKSLKELGASSLDRAEISTEVIGALGLEVPGREMASVKNIGEFVDFLCNKLSARG